MRTLTALTLAMLALGGIAASVQAHGPGGAVAARQGAEPPLTPTPRASCGDGDNPEPGIQGRVSAEDVSSGRAARGFWCNARQLGHHGDSGGFNVHRYVDEAGRECAYYDTTLLYPLHAGNTLSGQSPGVAVLDMTDPRNPVRTTTLATPAMQSPHESVKISKARGLLAAVAANPAFLPGIVDVYDLTRDCRNPVLRSSLPVGFLGHEGGFAPDGMTYYTTSIFTGHVTAVDLANPAAPVPVWSGSYQAHGLTVSDDGNRVYIAGLEGLVILDSSEIQARKPDPQAPEISRLTWPSMTVPQVAIPVTIAGRPYVVEVDEYSRNEGEYVSGNGAKVGAARIIDVADETKPRVVSNIRLEVHQPERRAELEGDPGAGSSVQGYAAHYCNVPQRKEPGILACSMILSGLRVFDIRDPLKPREIAYFVAPPAPSPVLDEPTNYAMASPDFAPERGEVWYSDGNSGFYSVKLDEKVWPFGTAAARCADASGFRFVGVRYVDRGLLIDFRRRHPLAVRVDVFRVSARRRVIKERLVARFRRNSSFAWDGHSNLGKQRRVGAGYYFVRFTALLNGKPYDTRRVVVRRLPGGSFAGRISHYRRDSCGLLSKFKLERPVFGGAQNAPLAASYRLSRAARVRVTVTHRARVVGRFGPMQRKGGETYRITLPAAKTRSPGLYRVRLEAVAGKRRAKSVIGATRL